MTTQLPVYVTRKTAHGETGDYNMSAWMALLALMLVWLNLVAWGLLGLVEAVRVLTG